MMSSLRTRILALSTCAALTAGLAGEPTAHARGSADISLVGLGLLGAGLVTSAGGFAVLYACREGQSCHNDTTTAVGWILAAPGLPPIGLGLLFLYLGAGSSSRSTFYNAPPAPPFAFSVTPVMGGGVFNTTLRF